MTKMTVTEGTLLPRNYGKEKRLATTIHEEVDGSGEMCCTALVVISWTHDISSTNLMTMGWREWRHNMNTQTTDFTKI